VKINALLIAGRISGRTCTKMYIHLYMCLTFTSLNLVLLWQLFYLFCSCIVINTVIMTAGTFEP